jgi:hypothetical protein
MLEAIATAQQAVAADLASLSGHRILAWSHGLCHLARWGPEPERALDAAWSAVEGMLGIDPLDDRTLTHCGATRCPARRTGTRHRRLAPGARHQSEFHHRAGDAGLG